MIRAPRLVVSRPMYAFNPPTWHTATWGGHTVDAVWFKRKKGVLVATMGTYHPMVTEQDRPTENTYEAWIEAADDNRYGGSHVASWDGVALLSSDQPVSPELTVRRVEFLSAMLAGFPDPPAGFDGWWTFPRPTA